VSGIQANQPGELPTKLLLTIDEAAAVMGVGKTYFHELLMRREIPSLKLGRRRLVPLTALHDFVARCLIV